MPTNGELKALLDQLIMRMGTYDKKQEENAQQLTDMHVLLEERASFFQDMQEHVTALEKRMKTLEDRVMPVLARVDEFFGFWGKTVKVIRRGVIFIAGIVAVQFLAWLIPHLLGH